MVRAIRIPQSYVVQQKHQMGFCLCCESIQVCINITDLRGSGCPMSVSCVNTQQVTILSQGVVVLKNCYLDLEVDAMGQRLGFFFFFF